ncbi:MAG: gliding motility lipoprotein GldD [Owenweeksia sp.]|nr:gliding motility lipoprotein GldD [Owenweeksia sp.]
MKKISLFLITAFLIAACGSESEDYTPKPRGYFRIQLPARQYQHLKVDCPYTFEYNKEATWQQDRRPCWGDLYYPKLKARLELTYKKVTPENLETLLKDGHELAYKHTVKAAGIQEKLFTDTLSDVHGILYSIAGEAATNTQFYMTDSTDHFLRGVLYFYAEPNVRFITTGE